MKTIFTLLLGLLLLTSCQQSKGELMQENITIELKKTMNDPSTFQFVSMGISKTFTVAERKKTMNEEKLKELREKEYLNKFVPQVEKEVAFLKGKDDNMDAVFYVDFVARGSNSFGAIVKNNYSATVLNDENRTVVHFKSMD